MNKDCKHTEEKARQDYVGAQQDAADSNRTNSKEVEEDVKELNNNPRNNDLDM
ncbi:MAG: hypothetical protein K2F70_00290 [Muribaculaceae bacterium]|nr:hypothetical protein [Muribaculaceae bacterium]